MYDNRRPGAPNLPNIPPGAQQPAVVAPTRVTDYTFPSHSGYTFEVTPPAYEQANLHNPWDYHTPSPQSPRPRVQSLNDSRPHLRLGTNDYAGQERMSFPEPVIHGSLSPRQDISSPKRLTHHHSRSDLGVRRPNGHRSHNNSVASFASSYHAQSDDMLNASSSGEVAEGSDLVKGLASLSLSSEEGLRRFQAGELPENDQEWHRLVPPQAREALGEKEVQRQSVIFEVIKSEREYVSDLEAVQDVFIKRLRAADPPILREPRLSAFINEVFGNLSEILSYHRKLLDNLFKRQLDQHPLIQSVTDIFLKATIESDLLSAYEVYIKRYPLAESHHRKQLKANRAYETFIHSASDDPRIRKRDLITFLSRPVTKLPRLMLLLEQVLKLTEVEYKHPDIEALPTILTILKSCVKSTQPGIEAAESKVKFWGLCESLVFQKGEIIDMDLYDESRSLVYIGPVMRRARSDTGFSEKWTDLVAALLDNYFILMREEKRHNGSIKRLLMSRPMPLAFLRMGSFTSPAETKREKAEDRGLLDGWRSQSVPVYPFTIYHAGNKASRRYVLYVTSDSLRKKWQNAFVDAVGVFKVRQDANMWFNPQTLTDGYFRSPQRDPTKRTAGTITGRIKCAVPFVIGFPVRRYLAVACGPGIYVGPSGSENFRHVLSQRNATALEALTTWGDKRFNRLVIHAESSLLSYPLDILTHVATGGKTNMTLEASVENVGGPDMTVTFFKQVHISGRVMLIVSAKRRLGTSLKLHVFEAVDSSAPTRRSGPNAVLTFRPYGEPGYIPKDATDISSLSKTIGVCTAAGIITLNPINISQPSFTIPEFQAVGDNPPMASLKERLEGLKPLGVVRANADELLVVYDEIGFYINKHGVPVRHSGYIKWEVKAVSYAHRNGHILLISPEFIEIRNITTSCLVQVIEGQDIRLLYSGPYMGKEDPVLVAMVGGKDDQKGVSEKIVELKETEEISLITPATEASTIWDEWDM